jgi:hypothetical protein
VLEHLDDKRIDVCMAEAHRCLKVGGRFEIRVPFGPIGTWVNDEIHHKTSFYPTSLAPYCQDGCDTTSLEYSHDKALFKMELSEVIRVFWQRQRLAEWLGEWIAKEYTRPKIGIPKEIHWILSKEG